MAVARKEEDLEMIVRCNMEVDLIEAELKALEEGLISKEVFDHLMSLKSKVPVAERYTTLLNHVHETIQENLKKYEVISSNPDMNPIATLAQEEGCIEKEVLDNIVSLHSQVPLGMRTRYILICIQRNLQKKLDVFKAHLLRVNTLFIRYKDMKSQCEKYSAMGFNFESVLMPLFPKQSESKIGSLMSQLEKKKGVLNLFRWTRDKIRLSTSQSEAVTTLGPQYLSKLNELLVSYAYKWKDIGVALNFQPQDLQTIEATPLLIPGAPKSYLLRLLQDWLQMTLRHTLPPTVENLKKALNSQTVGLGVLCSDLQSIVNKATHSFALSRPYCSTKVSFHDKRPSLAPLHKKICIQEGESTLLEIEVITANKEDIAYTWQRRGKAVGTLPILYLYKADIADQISCEVKASSTKSVTVPITVHVSCPLDEFTPSLASMYLSRPEVPEDSWPPTGSTKYINLAIIKQQKVNYGSEYARFTIRGDIDDVLQDKEMIAYSNFYATLKSEHKVMFIEGRPGSGKTTFVHKITHDWASDSSGGIRLLLLVSLRVLNTLCNPNLSDILHLFRDLKVTPEIIEKRDGKGVCFIFDGLDEFSPSDGKDSIVYKIIDRSYLHQSTVVVASRPAALAEIRRKADSIIEVLGFMSDQIQEYFDQYPFSDATKPVKLKTYLSLHPNIFHMCYLPIHATMVAFLFEVTGQVPKTETKMYELFTHLTLTRSISKNKELEPIPEENIFLLLNDEEKLYFKQICQLALDKTLLNRQVLRQEEISFHFKVSKKDISLGLITIDRTAGLYSFKDIYTFLHLTFQEYLAAYHISSLSDKEQMKLIEEHGHKNHMLVVWKFFCGLIEIKPLQNKFKTLLHKTQGNTLYHFQCAYESQQQIVCAQLLKAVHYDIKIANKFLRIPDFTAIGYVTNTTNIPIKLSLMECDIDVVAVLSEMEEQDISTEFCTKLLANFQPLKSLSLMKQKASILPQNQCEHFPVLKKITTLSFQRESQAFQMTSLALKRCENLTDLNISSNKIGEFDAGILSESLPHCKSLKKINFSMYPAAVQKVLNSMKHLKIKHMQLCIDSSIQNRYLQAAIIALSKALQLYFNNIEILVLNKFINSFEGAKSLTDGLQKCLFLKVLDLSDNQLEEKILEQLVSINFSKLEELYLDNSSINDNEVILLSSRLQSFPSLQVLSLRHNYVTSSGAKALAAKLHNGTKLKLNLQGNLISTADYDAIFKSHPANQLIRPCGCRCNSLLCICIVLLVSILVPYIWAMFVT